MKETSFIEQNKNKWKRFENVYASDTANPDELSNLFVEITEDLSFARTHYPKRTVRVYLNGLAQQVFTSLYKVKQRPLQHFGNFWLKSLPLEMYRMQKELIFAFVVFLVCAFIGVISTANDLNFLSVVTGDAYVMETNRNIAKGDPMGIYKNMDQFPMFTYIFMNNIMVMFFMFISGISFGIFTFLYLASNGIMLGTFQSYFYFKGLMLKKALLYTTFLTIWIHGAFEISACVISGACGFTLGRSLLFPGTLTRLQSLQVGAKRGIKVIIGLSVFIFLAAILESYVTRYTEMPEWAKLLIIFGSFAIMIFVFVVYPIMVARKYPYEVEVKQNPRFNPVGKFKLFQVRTLGEVFTDTFTLYRRQYKRFAKYIWTILLPLSALYLAYVFYHNFYMYNTMIQYEQSNAERVMNNFLNLGYITGVSSYSNVQVEGFFFFLFAIAFCACAVFYSVLKYEEEKLTNTGFFKFVMAKLWGQMILLIPIYLIMYFLPVPLVLLSVFVVTFFLMPTFSISNVNFFKGIGRGFRMGGEGYANALGGFVLMLLLMFIFFLLVSSQVFMAIDLVIQSHLITQIEYSLLVVQFVKALLYLLFLYHVFPLMQIMFVLFYYHLFEIETSHDLFLKLEKFGREKKNYENYEEND